MNTLHACVQVGMMRDGRLLAEAPPASLIQSYRLIVSCSVSMHSCVHTVNIHSRTWRRFSFNSAGNKTLRLVMSLSVHQW